MTASRLRSIAFYLPQFHPIPENDRWWGTGFTEWNSVVRARPAFMGHHQPNLPGELGFYDLRVPEVRIRQAELARSGGIDAFCYYHYWFEGTRLLHRPLDDMLASGEPDFPFCVCWANEDWRANWDGRSGNTLQEQTYSEADDRAHGRWLAELCADPRYVRVGGRPLVLVYRATDLPDARRLTDTWRREFVDAGVPEPLLCRVASFPPEHGDPRALGFDAAIEFQPNWSAINGLTRPCGNADVVDYDQLVESSLRAPRTPWTRYRGVTPSWDNTPRRPTGSLVFRGATPETYCDWVAAMAEQALDETDAETLLFVNAWNEWGEGAHLEPSAAFGTAFLDAHRVGIERAVEARGETAPRIGPREVEQASSSTASVAFTCNVCGQETRADESSFDRDSPTCGSCGSSVRFRALTYALTSALVGAPCSIPDLPYEPTTVGMGLSDWDGFAPRLAERISYRATYYDREPRLDITAVPPELASTLDLLIASDVLEHTAPPLERAFAGAYELLRPGGLLVLTVPFVIEGTTVEHYPSLHQYTLVHLDEERVLVNRTADGRLEVFDELVFHGWDALEMRVMARDDVLSQLRSAGFTEITEHHDDVPELGIRWAYRGSYPITARRPH